jgi:hypothetical protein
MTSEYLGEGSYGCVVKPPIKCKNLAKLRKGNKDEKLVGKIFTSASTFNKEIIANKNIIKIDPTAKKLLTAVSHCDVSMKDIKATNRAKHCEFIHGKKQPYLYQLNMPYGGVTFKQYFKYSKFNIYIILHSLINVFETLILLENKKMCHQDIKPDNILVKPTGESILIDYSLIIPFDKIYNVQNRHRLKYSYFPYPPEYKIFEFVYFEKCYKYDYCSYLYNNYRLTSSTHSNINLINKLFNSEDIVKILEAKCNLMIQKDKAGKLDKYMYKFVNRIDIYSVGMSLIKTIKYVYDYKNIHINSFISHLIHPDFEKRYNPKQALKHLKILLNII